MDIKSLRLIRNLQYLFPRLGLFLFTRILVCFSRFYGAIISLHLIRNLLTVLVYDIVHVVYYYNEYNCVLFARLGLFLFTRVLKEGQDRRFNKVRDRPGTFFVYWTIQGG